MPKAKFYSSQIAKTRLRFLSMTSLLFILFFSPTSFAELSPNNSYQEGIRLMQDEKYAEAATVFEKEFKSGKNFATLFFNWGLSAYKLQKRGLALALWRRALYIEPSLSASRQAISFISTELSRESSAEEQGGWYYFRASILDRASLNTFLFFSWLPFIVSGFLLIRYFGAKRNALKSEQLLPKFPVTGVICAAVFIVSFFLTAAKAWSLTEPRATIINTSVSLRTGPSLEDNSIFDLMEGLDVTIRQAQNSWALITLNSGVSGWVPTSALFQHAGRTPLW
ncbi:MAG: hypothetical protein A2Z20_01915 [Bdellovibrionales bacterium RBG_16_40_8]|nr:MAG: hypothetical protein A2Z20_01915 [Bdellovibrionales bacterium RBG_16_40_8]